MAQKNATPSKEQSRVIATNGLKAWEWTVMQDLQHSMIIRNRFTGDVKHIRKDVQNETNKTDVPR